jgi:ABC-2 type transport system ATP-binding protein
LPTVVVDSLKKSYGNLHAVNGISFTLDKGEVFSLLGPNGAGKTTTVEILEGLRERDDGDVKVLGLDPWSHGYELHKKMGIIPQGFRFFDYISPKEAIKYYATLFAVKIDVDAILKEVLLDDAASVYYNRLSGGQRQKLGLALSLVNDPEIVFLDEPTTGLDPAARRAVWDVIRNLKREGRCILLTTHYLEEAQELSDRVAIMNNGVIITSGKPEEIITKHGSGERLLVRGSAQVADYLRRSGLKVDFDGEKTVSVDIGNKHDAVTALAALDRSGLDWGDLRTQRDTLEDIFVRMVGKQTDVSEQLVRAK